ncbi:hypothetical protein GETHLI_13990 [Geothrix limicola]|uniref:Uncharacterized protein n=1 Tax=Geothrix limicola TaxID=2927978 RepID=A0ABQ5QE10_9BACT|nr:hypothetical protein [Geothrix limicola]GLH72897.1 hypothetical protein GETHLI_13990 [Geothrix limicola]
MHLTSHDLRILRLAACDGEGRLGFFIGEDGAIALVGRGQAVPIPADESLPKLEEMGLLSRELSRSYVLTPEGWDALRQTTPE